MSNQIIYTIKINCNDCNFILIVNDRPVLDFSRGANINTELPVNTFLQNGQNAFNCKIVPPKGQEIMPESARVKITIIENNGDSNNPSKELVTVNTPSFKPEDGEQPPTQSELHGNFLAVVYFTSILPLGADFIFSEFLKNEIFQAYMNLRDAFKNKDISEVMRLLSLKIKEYSGLKGTSLIDMENEMREDYLRYINDATLELWEFTIDKVHLKIYGHNKLACLEVKNGNQPICFINRPDHIAIYIPVYFYRNSQNKMLEIIR